jgi:hypothetical protein
VPTVGVGQLFTGDDPNGMDKTEDIKSENSQEQVNPKVFAQTHLQKNTQGRQKNSDNNADEVVHGDRLNGNREDNLKGQRLGMGLNNLGQVLQKGGRLSTINNPMIAGYIDAHLSLYSYQTLFIGHHLGTGSPNGQNSPLTRGQNGIKTIDTKHPQIRNGKGAAIVLFWL